MDIGFVALLAAIGSNILWGSTFMASKVVLKEASPIGATLIRFGIAILVLAAVGVIRKKDFQWAIVRKNFSSFLALGLIGYTALYGLQMSALKIITSSQSSAIMLLAPVFTLFTESILNRDFKFRNVVVTVLGLSGAALILFDQYKIDLSQVAIQALLVTIAASLCLGVSVVQTKKLLAKKDGNETISVFNVTFFSLVIGAIGLVPFYYAQAESGLVVTLPLSSEFWLWSLYLGVVCSVVAFLMWNWSVKQISPVSCAVAMYLKTPVALLLGAFLLREHLSMMFYFGTILILTTLFTNQTLVSRGTK